MDTCDEARVKLLCVEHIRYGRIPHQENTLPSKCLEPSQCVFSNYSLGNRYAFWTTSLSHACSLYHLFQMHAPKLFPVDVPSLS